MQSTNVKAKTVRRKHQDNAEIIVPDFGEQKSNVIQMIQIRRKDLATVSDKVAEDNFFHINYYPPGLRKLADDRNDLWLVRKYYPYSKFGALYIDEPQDERELLLCKEKEIMMKKLGHKYLIIKRGDNELDCIEALV